MRLVRHIVMLLAALALAAPGTAAADWKDVIRDCNEDERLDGNYSDDELREAEQNLPTDIDEYTACRELIQQARARGGRKGAGGAGGAGGGALSPLESEATDAHETPEEKRTLADATRDRSERARDAASVTLGDARVTPGGSGEGAFKISRTAANDVPLPVIVVLVCLALLAAAGSLAVIRRRVPLGRLVPLRIFRR